MDLQLRKKDEQGAPVESLDELADIAHDKTVSEATVAYRNKLQYLKYCFR